MNCDLSNCGVCYSEYNTEERIPRILPSCNHTVCSPCLEKLVDTNNQIQCPLCIAVSLIRKSIKDLPLNTKIMQRMEEKLKIEFCSIHKEEITAVCMDDKMKICRRCLYSSPHKGHTSKSLKEVQLSGKSKKENFGIVLKQYAEKKETLEETILKEEEALKKIVLDGFEIVEETLKKKQESLFSIISSFFAKERSKLENNLGKDASIIKETEKKISELSKITVNPGFLESFESETPKFGLDADAKLLHKHILDFKQKLEEALQSFSTFVVSHTQEFKFVFSVNDYAHKVQTTLFEEEVQGSQVSESKCFFTFEDNKQRLVVSSQENMPGDSTPRDRTLTGDQLIRIKEIDLRFNKKGAAQEVLDGLQNFWKHLKEISGLKVHFKADEVEDKDFLNFCSSDFWARKDTKYLDLNFSECDLSETALETLSAGALALMTSLKEIVLTLKNTKVSNSGIDVLTKSFVPVLENVEVLDLCLTGSQIVDGSLDHLWSLMGNVKIFKLDLEGTGIGDKTIEKFVKNTLTRMKNLEILKLNLSSTQITDESITLLFTSLPNIKCLSLSLSNTKITTKSIKVFAKKTLPLLTQLVDLELNIDNTQVDDSKVARYFADAKLENSYKIKLNNGEATINNLEMFIEKKSSGLMSKLKHKLHFK